jgi:ribosomal protein S18 acetylase RimI-like enzyme
VSGAGPRPTLRLRPLEPGDQARLWHWLHVALWDPPPAPLRPLAVLQQPGVRIYAEDWGRGGEAGDIGVVAALDGEPEPIGACWMRQLPAGVGLASVDEHTPQLGIALEPAFQHRGHGGVLMRAALLAARERGVRQVSLTVHPQNPAIALYGRCGFVRQGLRGTYHLMVARLDQALPSSELS